MRKGERISCAVMKRDAPRKKASSTRRKVAKRRTDFKLINWYSMAALSVAIPHDRRDQR